MSAFTTTTFSTAFDSDFVSVGSPARSSSGRIVRSVRRPIQRVPAISSKSAPSPRSVGMPRGAPRGRGRR